MIIRVGAGLKRRVERVGSQLWRSWDPGGGGVRLVDQGCTADRGGVGVVGRVGRWGFY